MAKKIIQKLTDRKIPVRKPQPVEVPVVSLEQIKANRKKINALNRSRAKDMERKVARILHGERIFGSGAFKGYKGDCKVPFTYGELLIECKLTESFHKVLKTPQINLDTKWLAKIHHEAYTMKCRFGLLVFHYFAYPDNIAVIKLSDVQWLLAKISRDDVFISIGEIGYNTAQKKLGSIAIRKNWLDTHWSVGMIGKYIACTIHGYPYIFLPLLDFAALLELVNNENH